MRKYSDRARRNTRNGIDMRILIIKDRIAGLQKEAKDYSRYLNKGLNDKWIRKVITTVNRKISTRKQQLRLYETRRTRWLKQGRI